MKIARLLVIGLLFLYFVHISCKNSKEDSVRITTSKNLLNVRFPNLSLVDARAGINLLTGKEGKDPVKWFPGEAAVVQKTDRSTPLGTASDISLLWEHQAGYELTWYISQLDNQKGFTLRASFKNNSAEPVRLKDFVLCETDQKGLVCKGDPGSWWLLPAMDYSRRIGNLAQVLPSKMQLQKEKVYNYTNISDDDPGKEDGHWRNFEDVISLYSDKNRKGVVIGAVGPGVSYVSFNCRVDNNNILFEVTSSMDGIVVDPGETRVSEEVLFLAQPYREALKNLYSWMAEANGAINKRDIDYGWCSWYHSFSRVNENDLLNVVKAVKDQRNRIPLKVIQLDDGWFKQSGDWRPNDKFPRGMEFYAEKIREAGAVPGIWMAPVRSLLEHPAGWVQNGKGRNLDPTNPEVEKFIISAVKNLKDAGFSYFKFDYNTIENYPPYNPKMTRFEIMRHLFSLYRQAIGEDCFMLACGATRRPVIGYADACRVGWDNIGRWKSYPLASDSLPTLGADIFNAIFTIALSSFMNKSIYIVDPDVTYLLPRADMHLWRGPKESFDSVRHGLDWAGLKTINSYVGLLGGTAMVSEPLDEEKYRQPDAVRMLEILNPPAPDKGWSMNGDIDPFGRQFGFIAERSWGKFASVALWNKDDISSDIKLDTYTLKDIGKDFHIWSFWDEKYMGRTDDASFVAKNVPAHGCALLRLTNVPEQNEMPVIIGSNLHISMGSAEIESVVNEADEFRIILTHAGARDGKIFIYSPFPLVIREATGCNAFTLQMENNIYAVVITDRSRNEKNVLILTKGGTIKSVEEIAGLQDLNMNYKKSGFDYEKMK